MRDQRDPQELGLQILANQAVRNCSILEAADEAEKQFIIGTARHTAAPGECLIVDVSPGLLSSPGRDGAGPTRRIFDEDGA